ncbi:MAG: cytochrome c [Myxococcota bacterium]|jgi:mono/diheme cytochrome c family protein|nr:cytochrome c [Myxococcota bacterium]
MIFRLTALLAVLPLALVAVPSVASASDAAAGKVIFDANCSSCHGVSGKGDGPVGSALTPPPRNFTVGDFAFDPDGNGTKGENADLILVIQNGAMKYGGSPLMAPWPTLSEEQVNDIVAHIRSLKAGDATE